MEACEPELERENRKRERERAEHLKTEIKSQTDDPKPDSRSTCKKQEPPLLLLPPIHCQLMQELHSITGVPARFFAVGGDGSSLNIIHNTNAAASSFVDRRLRQHPQHNHIVKCPRCDSPNTKFCYYNNYNLSQPRHFCKSCRRYWTKGGVLRNVPVGGGCRKSKRSNSKSSPSSSNPKSSKLKVENHREPRRCPPANSRSSSDSSSLTVAAAVIPDPFLLVDSVPTTMVEADGGKIVPTGIGLSSTMAYEFPDYSSSTFPISNQGYEQGQINEDDDRHVFAAVEEMSLPDDMGVCFLDQTVPVDLPPLIDGRIGNSDADLTGLDWHGCLDPTVGFFDTGTSTVAGGNQGLFWPLG